MTGVKKVLLRTGLGELSSLSDYFVGGTGRFGLPETKTDLF